MHILCHIPIRSLFKQYRDLHVNKLAVKVLQQPNHLLMVGLAMNLEINLWQNVKAIGGENLVHNLFSLP